MKDEKPKKFTDEEIQKIKESTKDAERYTLSENEYKSSNDGED